MAKLHTELFHWFIGSSLAQTSILICSIVAFFRFLSGEFAQYDIKVIMQLFYKKKQNHIVSKIFSKLISTDFKSFLRKVFLQLNPAAKFYDNWHIDLIINYLLAIETGKLNRLIINMPPRS